MSTRDPAIEELLGRYVEHRERTGERLSAEALCAGRPEFCDRLADDLRLLEEVDATLSHREGPPPPAAGDELPAFSGFRTVERIGGGGMGEVYKLEDLQLGRTVAAKVLKVEGLGPAFRRFLDEARALALFQDRRIVQVFEYRASERHPVLIMEHVDGFDLATIGPSLSLDQRVRILAEVCDAIDRAHGLGLQHRDLKPTNVLVDAALQPKIVDFGLSGGDPRLGHGAGTLAYMAPEQLDPERAIDAKSDVYALGVTLYELLSGERPYTAPGEPELVAEIRAGRPRLPVEVDPSVPEPLQAIALKAMEPEPEDRYASARAMATELRRYLEGRPVLARPTLYASALAGRLRPHLDQIREWLDLKLIYPHEADGLRSAYRRLEGREDDWIVQARRLTFSQIALYLGAFLLFCGSLFYFVAHRLHGAVDGLAHPLLVLGLPFVALTVGGVLLDRRDLRGVAIPFYLGGAVLLPVLLLVLFHEAGWWIATAGQFFEDGVVSNRQLQVATFLATAWTLALALRTRTVALSSIFTSLLLVSTLAVLTDLGLREWLEDGRWDLLSSYLVPLLLVGALLGIATDRRRAAYLATPLYLGAAGLFVLVLELAALDGRELAHLGITLAGLQPEGVEHPALLDTLGAMTFNGLLVYLTAIAVERYGSETGRKAAHLLLVVSPFLVLEPIAYLSETEEYSPLFDWSYLALALAVTFVSRFRQRKSFYYAGLLNTGLALVLIARRYEWLDAPAWPVTIIAVALLALLAGLGLTLRERTRRRDRS